MTAHGQPKPAPPDLVTLLNGPRAWLDAQGTLSATLLCGCRWAPGELDTIHLFVRAGMTTTCHRHGDTLIIRTTEQLHTPFGKVEPQPPKLDTASPTG